MSERLRVELKFKNARLYNALEQVAVEIKGKTSRRMYKTIRPFCEAHGLAYGTVMGFVTLRESPWLANGSPREQAEKLSFALGIPAEELFPVRLYSGAIPKMLAREIDADRYISLLEARRQHLLPRSTEDVKPKLDREMKKTISEVLETLTPREQIVIEESFGLRDGNERSLEDIGASLAISRARAGQIREKAMHKLRHPCRRGKLRRLLEEL